MIENWWTLTIDNLFNQLGTDSKVGLSKDQVELMRNQYGMNEYQKQGPSNLRKLLWDSIRSPMMVLLLTIALISLILRDYGEAIVMIFVVFSYIGVELINKRRSDRIMARLRSLQTPTTKVIRKGQIEEIPIREIVVGDILLLQTGSVIAADARLVASVNLQVDESALTGEASPQKKESQLVLTYETPIAERINSVFAGTTVLDGEGQALVVAVGAKTEYGKIAEMTIKAITKPTPLQQEMRNLTRILAYIAIIVSFIIPLIGWVRGYDLQAMILIWLSLTFLMVPGQPPIIITMALALASFELTKKQIIVRHLRGAETFSSVTVLLSDKTGTITENRMTLVGFAMGNCQLIPVENSNIDSNKIFITQIIETIFAAIPKITNDPTDKALITFLDASHISLQSRNWSLIEEIGFLHGNQYRSLEYLEDNVHYLYIAGTPEYLIDHSSSWLSFTNENAIKEWSPDEKMRINEMLQTLTKEGKRVIAYGFRSSIDVHPNPDSLVFIGLAILNDPVRPEVKDAIQQLRDAHVRTIMVTGDNPNTAQFVAKQIGLDTTQVIVGNQLDMMDDTALRIALTETSVFARTTPTHKLRLVQFLQQQNEIVAVTGDGINDAPALRTAHVGIAMGIRGTDIAKEASDLILLDDNFAHLPNCVQIGRKAFDNFQKGITYYLTAKAILLAIFIIPLILGLPFPLAPIQIIYTELLMDLASSTIFVSESAELDLMQRSPRTPTKFISWNIGKRILQNLIGLTGVILVIYFLILYLGYGETMAQTAVFATWLLGHILLALNLKQTYQPLFRQGLTSNRFGVSWLVGMIVLVILMTSVPAFYSIFSTTALFWWLWLLIIGGITIANFWIEIKKWIRVFKNKI